MTRRFSDYAQWPDLTETVVQDTVPTESYGNFGLKIYIPNGLGSRPAARPAGPGFNCRSLLRPPW